MITGTRERIVATTAELLRRQGFNGTGLKQIVTGAHAPFGSLYHFFPGGKDELGAEVIRTSGAMYAQLIADIFDAAPDLVTGVRQCFDGAADVLRQSDYADACPIETVALEVASTNETLRAACADVFESWIAGATRHAERAGIPRAQARELAIVLISALEGAFVLSRTLRDASHVESAGRAVAALVAAALAGSTRAHKPRVKSARRRREP